MRCGHCHYWATDDDAEVPLEVGLDLATARLPGECAHPTRGRWLDERRNSSSRACEYFALKREANQPAGKVGT